MKILLVCLLAIVVVSVTGHRKKKCDITEKATEICYGDTTCLANIGTNAKPCMHSMKKGKGKKKHMLYGLRSSFGTGSFRDNIGGGLSKYASEYREKEDKKQVLLDCFIAYDVTNETIVALQAMRKHEFKDYVDRFFSTLEVTEPTRAEDINCCIGQNMTPPQIDEDRQLIIENVESKFSEKFSEVETDLYNTYMAAIGTCAAEYTGCHLKQFKECTIRECIINLPQTYSTETGDETYTESSYLQ